MVQFKSLPVNAPLRITSPFGKRNTGINGASKNHMGVDLGRDFSKSKTPILSVADGTVTNNYWNDIKGWTVIIQHDGFKTLSQHLESKCPLPVGTKVSAGTQIGVMGKSSKTLDISIHLHFELIVNGVQVNSESFLHKVDLLNKVKSKFGLSDSTIDYLSKYRYAVSLCEKLLAGAKDFSDETISYLKLYEYGNDLIKKLEVR